MSFYVFFLTGVLGGLLGGMGMGGGTALIPALTLLCGVEQGVAQGVNLLSFLPMSAVALSVHARRGLVKKEEALALSLPALAISPLLSLVSACLPPALLKTAFGGFLIILALLRLRRLVFPKKAEKGKASYHDEKN